MRPLIACVAVIAAATGPVGCGDGGAPDRAVKDAPVYSSSEPLDRATVLVQYARNGAEDFESADARELGEGLLAVRVRVSYPSGPNVGLPDNLVISCVRLILSEPTDARQVVGWGGRRPRPLPGEFYLSRRQARGCPAVEIPLERG